MFRLLKTGDIKGRGASVLLASSKIERHNRRHLLPHLPASCFIAKVRAVCYGRAKGTLRFAIANCSIGWIEVNVRTFDDGKCRCLGL
jgi:hypothetical protein